jgi:hypothetical protein
LKSLVEIWFYQQVKIITGLVEFYDLYSQTLSPGHKIYHPLTFCCSLQIEFHVLIVWCYFSWNVGSEAILFTYKYVIHEYICLWIAYYNLFRDLGERNYQRYGPVIGSDNLSLFLNIGLIIDNFYPSAKTPEEWDLLQIYVKGKIIKKAQIFFGF